MTAPAPDPTAHPAGRRIAQHVVRAGWVMRPLPAQVPHEPCGRDFERQLADLGVRLLRPARKGEPERA